MDKDGLGSGPQALGGEGPQAVSVRVARWRAAHGVRLDEDFAFAFCSLEKATRDAGPEVAVAWQQARGPPKEGITTAMIDELSAFLVNARCRRPRREISVKRLVQNHAATAEAATFKNAIKTLQELYHFQILRGRAQGLEEVDPVDLDAFLHGGTTAPTRGLQALRWISKNAHLNLSTVRKITPSTVHCFCTKGKQAKLRQGFYWCVPATFSNRFAWTKPWVDQFLLLSPARRKHCGLVFDMRGRPWSRLESVRATQDEFRAVLEEPSLLTSYSWRRLGTTVGLLANFSVPQLAALGDWGDRINDTQAKMPVHYAGSRYALSRFCKHYAYYVASHVRDYTAWEVIPPPAVDEACRLAKDRAALAVEQDCTVVWSSPARSSLEPPRLRLTAAARDRVRKHSNAMAYSSCRRSLATSVQDQRCEMGPFYARSGTKLSASMGTLVLLLTAVPRSIGQAESVEGTARGWSVKVQWVNVHTTPAPKPPARKRGGTAEGVTPKRVRRGPEPAAGRGPEPASSSHRGPAAADEEFVDVLVEDEPEPVPMTPPPRARVLPRRRRGLGDRCGQLSLCPSPLQTPKPKPAWLGAASGEADHYVCNTSRRHPHPLQPTCAGTAPPLWAGGLAGLSLGPGTGSQEWSDFATP